MGEEVREGLRCLSFALMYMLSPPPPPHPIPLMARSNPHNNAAHCPTPPHLCSHTLLGKQVEETTLSNVRETDESHLQGVLDPSEPRRERDIRFLRGGLLLRWHGWKEGMIRDQCVSIAIVRMDVGAQILF